MLLWHCIFVGWPLLSQASVEIVSVSLGGGNPLIPIVLHCFPEWCML